MEAKTFICKYVDFLKIILYMPCWHAMYLESSPIGVTAYTTPFGDGQRGIRHAVLCSARPSSHPAKC